MARLLYSEAIWLVITGTEKRTVLENAPARSPIGTLLACAGPKLEVFWCP